MSKPTGKICKKGPITYSMPDRPTKTEPLVDPNKVKPKSYKPNRVKFGLKEGESRFPSESIPPNKKKYNKKGKYVKHQNESQPRKSRKSTGSMQITRELSLSNPHKRKKISVKY